MGIKISSLKQLGKGKWRVAQEFGGNPKTGGIALRRRGGNGRKPQSELYEIIRELWPTAQSDYVGAVVGRKYELDVALVEIKLGAECDGWQFHGKRLADFVRDRKKDRLLLLSDWKLLRFSAGEIMKEPDEVRRVMKEAIAMFSDNKE